jgi:L-fucose mutarotase
MLKDIDPILTGELLLILDRMGHGDVLGLVDRNFPAYRYDAPVVDMRGSDTTTAARAILSVLPLDSFVPAPVRRMEIDGKPAEMHTVSAMLQDLASSAEGRAITLQGVERFEFYRQAERATAFVQTGETVGYSCYLLQKGVV